MKTLILMRHAKSDWSKPGQRDEARALNKRGRLAAGLMGNWLREEGHAPRHGLVSSAERTQQTWARLGFEVPADFREDLYLTDAQGILAAIRSAPDCDCLIVLGHNPGMEAAMGMMTEGGKRISAPTAATGIYGLAIASWPEARFGAARPLAFETPKSLV